MNPYVVHEILSYVVPATVMIALGVPIVRLIARRLEPRSPSHSELAGIEARLERIESAVDAIAVEVERITEAQRFSARLQAEQAARHLPGAPSAP